MQDAYYNPEALDYACSVYVDSQTFLFRFEDGVDQLLRRDILLVRYAENGPESAFYIPLALFAAVSRKRLKCAIPKKEIMDIM